MSNPKARRIDFYPDEYIAGVTGTLTPEEQGVYWLVCSLIYSRGGPIDNDPKWLSRMFSDTGPRHVKTIVESLLAKGKLEEVQGKLGSNRTRKELELAVKRIQTNRKHGAMGGRPPNKINGVEHANGSGDQNPNYQLPTTNNQPPTTKEREEPASGGPPPLDDDDLPKYSFEARHIRLNPADFHRWQMSFPHLALRAELEGLDEWAGRQPKWYPAVASALAKREREVVGRQTLAQDTANGEAHLTPDQRREAQRKRDLEGIL